MQLTWLVTVSVLFVGVGYVVVQRAQRSYIVCWTALAAALFALATRDLFRSREQARPAPAPRRSARRSDAANGRPDRADGDRQRTPLIARLRRRLAGWLG